MAPSQSDVTALMRRAIITLSVVAILLALHRRFWTDSSDPRQCNALLNSGKWLDRPRFRQREKSRTWQPPGCLLHEYTAEDIRRCVGEKRMVFIGDASVRQIFWAIAKKLDNSDALHDMISASKEEDIDFKSRSTDVHLQFVWDPYLNSTKLSAELRLYQEGNPQTLERDHGATDSPATVIVVGGGLWYARQFEIGAVRHFTSAVNSISLQSRRTDFWPSKFSSVSEYDGMGDQLIFLPVEQPFYEILSPSRKLTIRRDEIDQMNGYLQELPKTSGLTIPWSFSSMSLGRRWAFEESGLHVIEPIIKRRTDVLLNLRCNAKLDRLVGAPFDRTCCGNYKPPGVIQGLLLLSVLAVLILWGVCSYGGDSTVTNPVLSSISMIGVVLFYCYIADRSRLFAKAHIAFNLKDASSLAVIPLLTGIISIRKSKSTKRLELTGVTESSDPGFLSRDQTDEFKGWMQAWLLLYHWTGSSSQLWIYQIVRLLLASYLFLTGYGQATFFLTTADYSFRRVTEVLIRLNLLASVLSYMMGTNYSFYYFAPLISFWFLVVFATLRVGQSQNNNIAFVTAKIVISALLITILCASPSLIDAMLGLLQFTYRVPWDSGEWHFRISTDPYIVHVGMLVAVIHIALKRESSFYSDRTRHIHSLVWTHFSRLKLAATVAALIILPGFWIVTRRSPDEGDYLWWMPWISWLPILSYIVLRNSCSLFRQYHSASLAWLGRISLATFTLQFHILLAADTNGTLSLGIFSGNGTLRKDRWRDLVFLLPVFLWLSWQVTIATESVTAWIIKLRTDSEFARGATNSSHHPVSSVRRKTSIDEKIQVQMYRGIQEKLPFAGDLRIRVAVIFGVLWCLNRMS